MTGAELFAANALFLEPRNLIRKNLCHVPEHNSSLELLRANQLVKCAIMHRASTLLAISYSPNWEKPSHQKCTTIGFDTISVDQDNNNNNKNTEHLCRWFTNEMAHLDTGRILHSATHGTDLQA